MPARRFDSGDFGMMVRKQEREYIREQEEKRIHEEELKELRNDISMIKYLLCKFMKNPESMDLI